MEHPPLNFLDKIAQSFALLTVEIFLSVTGAKFDFFSLKILVVTHCFCSALHVLQYIDLQTFST